MGIVISGVQAAQYASEPNFWEDKIVILKYLSLMAGTKVICKKRWTVEFLSAMFLGSSNKFSIDFELNQ